MLLFRILSPESYRRMFAVHLICLLQVFCFLSFYVFDVFLFFFFLPRSSSSPSVAAFCSFSFSLWSPVLGLALGLALVLIRLFYDDNRICIGGVCDFFVIIIESCSSS